MGPTDRETPRPILTLLDFLMQTQYLPEGSEDLRDKDRDLDELLAKWAYARGEIISHLRARAEGIRFTLGRAK